jgi:hypothetical protein
MVPGAFVTLDRLPLTSNGKLDHGALPLPGPNSPGEREYERPEGDVESAIAAIWESLLGLERVGRRDNFFELGGHSLLATQAMARTEKVLSLDLPIRLLFESATVMDLSRAIGRLPRAQFKAAVDGLQTEAILEKIRSMPDSAVEDLIATLVMEDGR